METSFLMCSERSGSNFISRIINSHTKICSPAPKHIFNPLIRNLYRYEPIQNKQNWDEILKDVLRLINAEFTYWKSSVDLEELRSNVEIGNIKNLLEYIFFKEAKSNEKNSLFIKENKVHEFFPYLQMYFPDSKYIFQTRDPRDMALSWKKNPSHLGGVVAAARQWKEDQQRSLFISNVLSHNKKVIHIRYEDLLVDLKKELIDIMDFFNLKFEDNLLNFNKDELTRKNSKLQPAWMNLDKGIMRDNSNKFLKDLSEEEIRIIEKICFFEMDFLGYKPINSWTSLQNINIDKLNWFDQEERQLLEHQLTSGVKANIAAKTIFYQKKKCNG